MGVIRLAERTSNFLIITKDCINNKELSFGARGLHAYLMSKPDNWTIMTTELIKASPSGKCVVYSLLNELINAGYVRREQAKGENGRFKQINYIVFETAQLPFSENQEAVDEPLSGFPHTEKPLTVNQPLLNIDNNKNRKAASKEAAAIISFELSNDQKILITERLKSLTNLKGHTFEQWQLAIEQELLNKESFKKSKQIFVHKLNIIFQQIEKDLWQPLNLNNLDKKDENKPSINPELHKLLLKVPGLERSIKQHQFTPLADSFTKELIAVKEQINLLKNLNGD